MRTGQYDVYAIGNALVDIQYRVTPVFLERMGVAKGVMTLIDETRRTALLAALGDQPEKRSSGGSAANTLIALANLGGRACYACAVGHDADGDFYLADLEAAGVATHAPNRGEGATGSCLVMITPDADRTMNTFLGASAGIGAAHVAEDLIRRSAYYYIEGYLLSMDAGFGAVLEGQRLARRHGVRVALTLSDPFIVHTFGDRVRQLVGAGLDILFCNDAEAQTYTGQRDIEAACRVLSTVVPLVAVTCGADGARIGRDGELFHAPGVKVRAVDTNGAGDMFAGAFLFGLTQGYALPRCARLATHAAAQVVAQYGPRVETSLRALLDG